MGGRGPRGTPFDHLAGQELDLVAAAWKCASHARVWGCVHDSSGGVGLGRAEKGELEGYDEEQREEEPEDGKYRIVGVRIGAGRGTEGAEARWG